MSLDERKVMMSAVVSANTNRAEKFSRTPCLNKLAKMGYSMTVWSARYGNYIIAAIGPDSDPLFNQICDLTSSGDIEACSFIEYIDNDGRWLPFESGETVLEAVEKLESFLSTLPESALSRGSDWLEKCREAYEEIDSASDGGYGIASAVADADFPTYKL